MTIAEMKRDRLEEYVRVFLTAFRGEPWREPWTQQTAGKRLARFMDTGSFFGLELEEDGAVIAFVLGQYEQYYDGLRFCIQEFCCGKRSCGYGTELLRELETCLKAQGVVRICLMTIHGETTERYYQRRGYMTDPENIWMYKTGL